MAIYGTPLTLGGGGGGKNETLPPLLDNFKANKGKAEIVPPKESTLAFKDIPDGKKIKLVKGSKISGTVTYGTTEDLNHRIVFDSKDLTKKKYLLENDSKHDSIHSSDIDQWLNSTKASSWWSPANLGGRDTNINSPDYASEQGFLYQLGITDEALAQNFNDININKTDKAKVGIPWVVNYSETIPYTFFKNISLGDFGSYAYTSDDTGVNVGKYDKSQAYTPKAPDMTTIHSFGGMIHPMMEPKPETPVALDSDGSYYMFEEVQKITVSADKMRGSRATDLAGAVWVYGDHIPNNVNDGTKIELDRNDVVSSELGLSLTLGELPHSTPLFKAIINIPESDGKLHPYIYLSNTYYGGGKEQPVGILLREDITGIVEGIKNNTPTFHDSPLSVKCANFASGVLAPSVRAYNQFVKVDERNVTTGKVNSYDYKCFALSEVEIGGSSFSEGQKIPYLNGNAHRIAKLNGQANAWWLRSINQLGQSKYILATGALGTANYQSWSGFRPVISVSLDLPLNPIPKEDGSYDFLEIAKSKVKTVKETKQTVGSLPSKSKVKLGRYGGNELSWITTKDAEGRQYLIFSPESMNVAPFKAMLYDEKESNNPINNIKKYGNNLYVYSNIHQWLNSDKSANNWYTPQHAYDAPPPYANQNGFLHDWTEQEKSILFNKVWEVPQPTHISTSMQKFSSKVTLPSLTEVNLNPNSGGTSLDIFSTNNDRKANGKRWSLRNPNISNDYQIHAVSTTGQYESMGAWDSTTQIRPIVSIPINTPVELGSDGSYRLLLDVMLPTVKVTVTYPKNKNFYARQFTYNPKKQYQTMLEGAIASPNLEPPKPEGQQISQLPSRSKVKLGKVNNTVLKWIVCRDTSDNQVRLILDGSSYNVLGTKQLDAPEPSNSNSDRRSWGNNRYIWSNMHQWLNTNKAANQWYVAQHGADAPPNYANQAGFLNQWTEKEIKSLEFANWTVTKTSVDGSGSETFQSRVTLASTTEIGLENGTGGGRLDIMNSNGDRDLGTFYWCRTPYPSGASDVPGVGGGGALDSGSADYADGVRPLLKPLSNTLVSLEPDIDGDYTLV